MSGLATVWGGDKPQLVNSMLDRMCHRGTARRTTRIGSGWVGVIASQAGGHMTGGGTGHVLAVDGWLNSARCQPDEAHRDVLRAVEDRGSAALGELNGEYALALCSGDNMTVARDPLGSKPMYRASLDGLALFASELKALPARARGVKAIAPGTAWSTCGGVDTGSELRLSSLRESPRSVAARLREVLERAVYRRLRPGDSTGLFLSGGLDSSAIGSILAGQSAFKTRAFAVGTAGCPDLRRAAQVAAYLNIPLSIHELAVSEMVEAIPAVIHHLESFDKFLVRSSVANFALARMAREAGASVVFCGEGADELFAGYDYLADKGEEEIRRELAELLTGLGGNGLQRVDRMTQAHGLEARIPFIDSEVVALAARIPLGMKMHGRQPVAKYVLRLAFDGSLPDEVLWRPKAKFYEGSGVGSLLAAEVTGLVADADVKRYSRDIKELKIRDREELYYYMTFSQQFPREMTGTVIRTRTVA